MGERGATSTNSSGRKRVTKLLQDKTKYPKSHSNYKERGFEVFEDNSKKVRTLMGKKELVVRAIWLSVWFHLLGEQEKLKACSMKSESSASNVALNFFGRAM